MTRPRLLFLVNEGSFFLSHRLPIARAAVEAGFDVRVAAGGDEDAGRCVEAAGLRFHPIRMSRSGARPWEELGTLGRIVSVYRAVRPDLVHHVGFKPIFHGSLASRLGGRPAIVNAVSGLGHMFSDGGRRERVGRSIMRWAYRIACHTGTQRVIVQNRDDHELFVRGRLARPDDVVLIRGSGVDPRRFQPRREPEGRPVVLFASRLLRTKGVGVFVEAARRLAAQGVEARFVIAGATDPGNLATIREAEIRVWEREGIVEWWGKRDDMPDVLARSQVVCLPTYYREGVPKVLIEAASAGRPIVTTDTPGCREIVHHGDNGFLVPIRDPDAVVEALRRLLADASLRRSMGARGRARVLEEGFTTSRVVEETLAVYEALLDERVPA